MNESLLLTAMGLGFVHTLLGPDHYLPFVALSKANHWAIKKTLFIATICGLAHCLSSVVLGFVGVGLGVAVGRMEALEAVRGDLASYLIIAFGLAYLVWSIKNLVKRRTHTHVHAHGDQLHTHHHMHQGEHVHIHAPRSQNLFWGVFIVFLFGPCEPLIPLLMYPAAKSDMASLIGVVVVFTTTTVFTMLTVILAVLLGMGTVRLSRLARYGHIMASVTLVGCGVLMVIGL